MSEVVSRNVSPAELELAVPPSPLLRRLRTETRVMWAPAATVTATGGLDMWIHEWMMAGLHTDWKLALIGPVAGAVVNGVVTALSGWGLANTGTLEGLRPTPAPKDDAQPAKPPNQLTKALGFEMIAGGILAGVGAQPLAVGGYLVVAAVGTVAWHKTRRAARKALRHALENPQPVLAPMLSIEAAGEPDPERELIGELTDIIGRWRDGVAGTHAPGSALTSPLRHDEGRMSFIVNGGKQGIVLARVNGAREEIRSALQLKLPDANGNGGQDIVFDQPGGLGLHRGQLRAQIVDLASSTATSQRVTAEIVSAPGNPHSIRIGCYIDDGAPAYWDLADEDGAWSGTIIASTGFGKSSLVDLIVYRARQLGFCIVYLDPTDNSSPLLRVHATWPLGSGHSMAAMHFAEDAATTRQQWMAMHDGVGKIVPGMIAPCAPNGNHPDPTCPCQGVVPPPMLIVVEECDLVFNEVVPGTNVKQGVQWGKLVKRIRKLCMAVIGVTQLPEIKAYGGEDLLRSNMATRNLLAMHVTSAGNGTLIPGLPYNPHLIPKKKGRSLMCGQVTRKMEIQLDRIPRLEDAAKLGGPGPWAEDMFEALPDMVIHPADAKSAELWMPFDRENAATAARDQARANYSAILSGRSLNVPATAEPETAATAATATVVGTIPETSLSWPEPVTDDYRLPTPAELAAMYAELGDAAPPVEETETAAEKTSADDAIWALLLSGVTKKGDLMRESGYGETHVRNSLNRLQAAGRVRKESRGEYRSAASAA